MVHVDGPAENRNRRDRDGRRDGGVRDDPSRHRPRSGPRRSEHEADGGGGGRLESRRALRETGARHRRRLPGPRRLQGGHRRRGRWPEAGRDAPAAPRPQRGRLQEGHPQHPPVRAQGRPPHRDKPGRRHDSPRRALRRGRGRPGLPRPRLGDLPRLGAILLPPRQAPRRRLQLRPRIRRRRARRLRGPPLVPRHHRQRPARRLLPGQADRP
mmetsp:Transcript_19320/g.60775  ORF Transcript_19320/g.60775 Transcript_19320/m.60775 type:complete len:212 (-) Transcript_19320:712-1347(-)